MSKFINYGAMALGAALLLPLATTPARAEMKVRSPIVEYKEIEIEHNGSYGIDRKGSPNRDAGSYTVSLGYGIMPFWKIELEAETKRDPGDRLRYEATTIENIFQLTPEGKYFADLGFFFEVSKAAIRGDADSYKFGPILRKELNNVGGLDTVHTLNIFVAREFGSNGGSKTALSYAWQSLVLVNPYLNPGFELYGVIADLGHAGPYRGQLHSAGPVLAGGTSLGKFGKLKYEVGYQFGLTSPAARGGVRWQLEFELPF